MVVAWKILLQRVGDIAAIQEQRGITGDTVQPHKTRDVHDHSFVVSFSKISHFSRFSIFLYYVYLFIIIRR